MKLVIGYCLDNFETVYNLDLFLGQFFSKTSLEIEHNLRSRGVLFLLIVRSTYFSPLHRGEAFANII